MTLRRLGRRPTARRLAQFVGCHAAIPLLRARARRRLAQLEPGRATVVTINWNSWRHAAVLIDTVSRRSPAGTRIIVVDNGSEDGSPAALRAEERVQAVRLPLNLGHELALDIGVLLAETEFVVALDIDAFPLRDDWLQALLGPLDAGAQVSGARLNREYVHPCCWAMRTARFVERDTPSAPNTGRGMGGKTHRETSARRSPRARRRASTFSR